jgi:hypothetical protein
LHPHTVFFVVFITTNTQFYCVAKFIWTYPDDNMFPTTLPQVSYISDSSGKRTAAIIPIQTWEEIEREITSEQETAYLSQNHAMKNHIRESRQQTETITFEEACAKLGVHHPERL